MAKQPQEVVDLAQRLLKAAGKQSPVVMMNALLLCMQLVDATTHGPRKVGSRKTATETHNAEVTGGPLAARPRLSEVLGPNQPERADDGMPEVRLQNRVPVR